MENQKKVTAKGYIVKDAEFWVKNWTLIHFRKRKKSFFLSLAIHTWFEISCGDFSKNSFCSEH